MASRHAEIAGAGLGGLATSVALAQRGWTVRVHERSDTLRMFGAGIWLLVVWVPILVLFALAADIVAFLLRRFGVLERAVRSSPTASAGD